MSDYRYCDCCKKQTSWVLGDGDEIRCYDCGVSEEYVNEQENK